MIDSCPNLLLLHFPTNGYLTDKIVENTRAIMALRAREADHHRLAPTATRR